MPATRVGALSIAGAEMTGTGLRPNTQENKIRSGFPLTGREMLPCTDGTYERRPDGSDVPKFLKIAPPPPQNSFMIAPPPQQEGLGVHEELSNEDKDQGPMEMNRKLIQTQTPSPRAVRGHKEKIPSPRRTDFKETEPFQAAPDVRMQRIQNARPPQVRFKMQYQFSNRFESEETKAKKAALHSRMKGETEIAGEKEEKDITKVADENGIIAWVNNVFAMTLKTEYHIECSFPIIILLILDVVFKDRIPWHKVDWRFHYARALAHNYSVVEGLWRYFNMEKALWSSNGAFGLVFNQHGALPYGSQMDRLSKAPVEAKIACLKLVRPWFDQRMLGKEYNVLDKRLEIVRSGYLRGFNVKFPSWIQSPNDSSNNSMELASQAKQPEYLNLIAFLGSPDIQSMS